MTKEFRRSVSFLEVQENFVAGKKLVLKALTPFQIGEEVC